MKTSLIKTSFREIRHSLGRFISITCIIALGVGFFSGLKIMMPDMRKTAQEYLDSQKFYDFKLMCTYGYTDESVELAKTQKDVTSAAAAYSADAIFKLDNTNSVFKVLSATDDINLMSVVDGRAPENKKECLADARYFGSDSIGKTYKMSEENDKDTLDNFSVREFKTVGIGNTPLYLNYERGNTKLGNGSLAGFMITTNDAFNIEAYTEMYLKLNSHGEIYSDEYNNYIDSVKGDIETLSDKIGEQRFLKIKSEATEKFEDGKKEYEENLQKFYNEKADAQKELDEKKSEYENGVAQYEDGLQKYESAKKQLDDGLNALKDGILKAKDGIEKLNAAIKPLEDAPYLDEKSKALLNQLLAQRAEAEKTLAGLESQVESLNPQIEELEKQGKILEQTSEQLESAKSQLEDGQKKIDEGYEEYESGKKTADEKFSDAQKKLDDAKVELDERL